MKIAIITDIHGNAPALRAVLNEIDMLSIDHIYCLGDLIAIGPNTNEVLYLLFSRNDISMITGNHDVAVLALIKGEHYPISHQNVRNHHEWIAERLDSSFIPRLANLPRTITETIDNIPVYFTHYRILPNKLSAHISEDPFHQIVKPSLENMEKLYKFFAEALICFGHHHPLHYFKGAKTSYLNPGSLGCNN
ncbi:metallophosphatase family protein [Caldibacillus lycopersici]|uniref:Metallophosphatase family protein n=1 Tax=Perspicuibacillus lycopersici TaxID=1325689 RepID=A0AAE3IWG7_9BACI|nr:metallophosphoesterase family protein [Perspicuibacillus lycopersici]MCU9614661.1 metallophosphatase family protein [Perspicuibacillus lycopersici]